MPCSAKFPLWIIMYLQPISEFPEGPSFTSAAENVSGNTHPQKSDVTKSIQTTSSKVSGHTPNPSVGSAPLERLFSPLPYIWKVQEDKNWRFNRTLLSLCVFFFLYFSVLGINPLWALMPLLSVGQHLGCVLVLFPETSFWFSVSVQQSNCFCKKL